MIATIDSRGVVTIILPPEHVARLRRHRRSCLSCALHGELCPKAANDVESMLLEITSRGT